MKQNLPGGLPLLGLSCLLWANPAAGLAQETESDPLHDSDRMHGEYHRHDELEEVIVRATPLERDVVEMSQSATVLSGHKLQSELANNIGDTLTRMPGLANASFGQNVGRPVIRGLQGQRVGVLADNMAASDASAVSQDHAVAIEPFLADQVEVLRGPSTLLYGSGAIGGVVNIVTHSIPQAVPEGGFAARALAQADSAADQRFAAGRLDLGGGSFAFHANGFYRRTDDYEIPGAAELYPEDEHGDEEHEEEEHAEGAVGILENSFLDNEGGTLGGSWIGDAWRFGLAWTSYSADYGIPGAAHHHEEEEHGDEGAEEAEEEEFVTIGLESDRYDGELVGTDPFAGFEQLKLRYARTEYTHTEFEGAETGTVFDSATDDARLELRHRPWGAFDGAFGLQYTDVDFEAIGDEAFVPPSQTRTGALFWVENGEFGAWQLELGLRYEDVDLDVPMLLEHGHHDDGDGDEEGHETGSASRGFNPFSASLGAIWHATGNSHLALTLAHAERAPTAQELFSFGPHIASQTFEVGSPTLGTEANTHLEASYRIHGGPLTGSIVIYTDRFDDYIYQENTGEEEDGLPVRVWSQQDADFIGGEIELRYDLGHKSSGHWQLYGFADAVRGELDDGHDVPLMPPLRLGLGLEWDRDAWSGTLLWIHADDHTRVADYETRTPGYDRLDLELGWLLPLAGSAQWELFLKGQNLLDEDIRNSTSYLKDQAPQIGRNFLLGLRVQL